MLRVTKLGLLYLAALLPLSVLALVWAVSSLWAEIEQPGMIILGFAMVGAAAFVKIELPRTNSKFTLSDAVVLLSLLYFGGEIAVLFSVPSALLGSIRRGHKWSAVNALTNICISIVTIFVTSVAITAFFGEEGGAAAERGSRIFIAVVATLAIIPLTVRTLLTAAHLAIRENKTYWHELKEYLADASLVYLGTGLMAGLVFTASRETNIFLVVAAAGFFAILHITFRRYRKDYLGSRKLAFSSRRERSKESEKHIAELKHYIGELEQTSLALKESREKYRHAAFHDLLTGLPNRNQFTEAIERLLLRARHVSGFRFALLYLDLRRFKTVNDSLGTGMGDHLIVQVGMRLAGLVKNGETIGRFSGDEFAILVPEIRSIESAEEFGEKIVEALSEPFELSGRQIFTTVSMGIAIGDRDCEKANDLIRDADIAMYRAKERNRAMVRFENNMRVQAVSLLQLETDLRLAVDRNEFELFYQPILDLETMYFAGVEALVRWSHPTIGRISPERFIEVSEATGLIIPMTLQILESACRQIKAWNTEREQRTQLFASINLSGRHFTHPDVVEHIDHVLRQTGVNPRSIKLEITETAVMDNAERAATVLKRIKDLGVQLSIDDFGTGYSSLSYLQRFPIDTLKIDRSFVRSMEDGRQNGEIVKAILALAEAMNLSVVAEGIESVHQLHQLRILNCQYGQGYLFSHPLPVSEIEVLLENPTRWENLVSGSTFSIVPPSEGPAASDQLH